MSNNGMRPRNSATFPWGRTSRDTSTEVLTEVITGGRTGRDTSTVHVVPTQVITGKQ